MGIFDEVASTIKKTAKSAAKKSYDMVDFTKLKIQLSDVRDEIREKYQAIGEAFYTHSRGEAQTQDEQMLEDLISTVDRLKEKEEELESVINELKSNKKCASCGATTDKDNDFCPKCGTKF